MILPLGWLSTINDYEEDRIGKGRVSCATSPAHLYFRGKDLVVSSRESGIERRASFFDCLVILWRSRPFVWHKVTFKVNEFLMMFKKRS